MQKPVTIGLSCAGAYPWRCITLVRRNSQEYSFLMLVPVTLHKPLFAQRLGDVTAGRDTIAWNHAGKMRKYSEC